MGRFDYDMGVFHRCLSKTPRLRFGLVWGQRLSSLFFVGRDPTMNRRAKTVGICGVIGLVLLAGLMLSGCGQGTTPPASVQAAIVPPPPPPPVAAGESNAEAESAPVALDAAAPVDAAD